MTKKTTKIIIDKVIAAKEKQLDADGYIKFDQITLKKMTIKDAQAVENIFMEGQ